MTDSSPLLRTARNSGYLLCSQCEKLHLLNQEGLHCDRCGARLHSRAANSMSLSWACLIASMLLFLPANLLPIMTFTTFGQGEPNTIIGGVLHLMEQDMLVIGLVVLTASIVVPVLKMIALTILLCTVQFGLQTNLRQKTMMFRIVEWIGRWSMLDIFVIGILVALVQLGSIAHIEGNHGATAFAIVVLLTMFSAIAFDTRLIWDNGTSKLPLESTDHKDEK